MGTSELASARGRDREAVTYCRGLLIREECPRPEEENPRTLILRSFGSVETQRYEEGTAKTYFLVRCRVKIGSEVVLETHLLQK